MSSNAFESDPIYWDTHLRTDGVHSQESAGTGTLVLKVVLSNGCCLFRKPDGPIFVRPLFPTPTVGTACAYYSTSY